MKMIRKLILASVACGSLAAGSPVEALKSGECEFLESAKGSSECTFPQWVMANPGTTVAGVASTLAVIAGSVLWMNPRKAKDLAGATLAALGSGHGGGNGGGQPPAGGVSGAASLIVGAATGVVAPVTFPQQGQDPVHQKHSGAVKTSTAPGPAATQMAPDQGQEEEPEEGAQTTPPLPDTQRDQAAPLVHPPLDLQRALATLDLGRLGQIQPFVGPTSQDEHCPDADFEGEGSPDKVTSADAPQPEDTSTSAEELDEIWGAVTQMIAYTLGVGASGDHKQEGDRSSDDDQPPTSQGARSSDADSEEEDEGRPGSPVEEGEEKCGDVAPASSSAGSRPPAPVPLEFDATVSSDSPQPSPSSPGDGGAGAGTPATQPYGSSDDGDHEPGGGVGSPD
jgi:hypothetical protein